MITSTFYRTLEAGLLVDSTRPTLPLRIPVPLLQPQTFNCESTHTHRAPPRSIPPWRQLSLPPLRTIKQRLLPYPYTYRRALPSPWQTNFKRTELRALVQLGLLPWPRVRKLDSLKMRRSGSSLRVFQNSMSMVLVC